MTDAGAAPVRYPIGTHRDVTLDVVVWDAASAQADISFATMFAREVGDAPIAGGLRHLDAALGGALLQLRHEGVFRGDEMETLLLSSPPPAVRSKALMLIGLGDPVDWKPELMARAARVAVREGCRLLARGVSFAPGLLDSGLAAPPGAGEAILRGVVEAIEAETRLSAMGLTRSPSLGRWSFGAGPSHAHAAAEALSAALTDIRSSRD